MGEKVVIEEGEEQEEDEIEEVGETMAPKGIEDDEGFESGTASASPDGPPLEMSAQEIIVWRKKLIAKRKQKIALLCTSIVERPEERMGKLKVFTSSLSICL